jgi:hypothetical protein
MSNKESVNGVTNQYSYPVTITEQNTSKVTSVNGIDSSRTKGPRKIFIQKLNTGFGFNVRGQVNEGGPLKIYNGEFYAPLQQVSAVLIGGAAEKAGLYRGDRILEVNGVNVDGATHKQVVDLIKSGNDQLSLVVISMPLDDSNRTIQSNNDTYLNNNNNNNSDDSYCSNDYSDRRPVNLSIPDFTEKTNFRNDKYIVFNIYMPSNRLLCSRRYKEFDAFHSILKKEFVDFHFPTFPSKWPFKMTDQQLDARRRALELYLDKICSVRVIFDSEIVREFLCLAKGPPIGKSEENTENHNNTNSNNNTITTSINNKNSKNKTTEKKEDQSGGGVYFNNTMKSSSNDRIKIRNRIEENEGEEEDECDDEEDDYEELFRKNQKKSTTTNNINDNISVYGGNDRNSLGIDDKQFTLCSNSPKEEQLEVELPIQLPDKTVVVLNVNSDATADQVYALLIEKIKLNDKQMKCFYLFEKIDEVFERKLRCDEKPHLVLTQNNLTTKKNTNNSTPLTDITTEVAVVPGRDTNKQNSSSSSSCLCMRKWYFNLKVESQLAKNPQTLKYIFQQVSLLN